VRELRKPGYPTDFSQAVNTSCRSQPHYVVDADFGMLVVGTAEQEIEEAAADVMARELRQVSDSYLAAFGSRR
jgi:hypothetical protein